MRINPIQSYSYSTVFNARAENRKKEHKLTAKEIGYGLAGLAAIGLATYAIIRKTKSGKAGQVLDDSVNLKKGRGKGHGKPEPKPEPKPEMKPAPPVEPTPLKKPAPETPAEPEKTGTSSTNKPENLPSTPPENRAPDNADTTNGIPEVYTQNPQPPEEHTASAIVINGQVKVTPELLQPYKTGIVEEKQFSIPGIGETEPFEGVEKLKYRLMDKEHGRTYQQFFHKNKIYETSVYNDAFGEFFDTERVTRYNFAYENGKVVGVAKQLLSENGSQHGIYQDGTFIPYPIMVKMKGDKEFHKVDAYTTEALFEIDKRFDPKNI